MDYAQYAANAREVWKNHPLGANLQASQTFMRWWDSLKPEERKALEDNMDARLMVLERWKLKCPSSLSPTQRTPQSAAQSSRTSASGQTSGLSGSQEQPGGKSR